MRWASTAVINAVSRPITETGISTPPRNVPMPDLPATVVDSLDPELDITQVSW
jgi:hypothetical protein